MTLPLGPVQRPPDTITAAIRTMKQQVDEATRQTLYSAVIGQGGLKITGSGGIQVTNGAVGSLGQFYTGGGSSANRHADGTPQIVTSIGDESGRSRLVLFDENVPASPTNQRIHEWDQLGNLVRSQDNNGGWAEPWFGVTMRPAFVPNGGPTSYSSNSYGFSYWNFATAGNGIGNGNVFWEGRIPYVSHPRLSLDGTWGQAAGSLTAITYTLTVGSLTFSWSGTTLVTASEGPFDISSLLRQKQVPIKLAVSWTGSGSIAADVLGCYLRQT